MNDSSEKLLDNTSWQILAILQENARIPFKELGKQVKLSAPAVAERVRKLEEAGVITRYRAELNLEKLGLPIMAFVTFRSFPDRCDELKLLLNKSPEVQSSYRITGGAKKSGGDKDREKFLSVRSPWIINPTKNLEIV